MNHFLRNGDGHLKNYGILYENDYEDARLTPIYDVITTAMYIKNDIPALRLSDAKLWWKEKTLKNFAVNSCGLSNKEYSEVVDSCIYAIKITKQEIDSYICKSDEVKKFLENLKECWREEI